MHLFMQQTFTASFRLLRAEGKYVRHQTATCNAILGITCGGLVSLPFVVCCLVTLRVAQFMPPKLGESTILLATTCSWACEQFIYLLFREILLFKGSSFLF